MQNAGYNYTVSSTLVKAVSEQHTNWQC